VRVNEYTVDVDTAGVQLCGPNEGRRGLVVSMQSADWMESFAETPLARNVDTSTTGIKLSYTVPNSFHGKLYAGSVFSNTGSAIVSALQMVRSGLTYNLGTVAGSGIVTPTVVLKGSDTVQWNVTTAIGASTADFMLSLEDRNNAGTVTLTLKPVVSADQDHYIQIQSGNLPLVLTREVIGDALRGVIYAVSYLRTEHVGVWDFFE
jgi:hypothetical protein